jgi:6-pyruvoyltetrahydropterin/6-carboxytetrahydropterin synthase
MEKITITRKIEFDAAHRIIDHESKCKYLHGHRYVLEVSFSCNKLDSLGRVVDFGLVKTIIKNWIDDNFDHTTILSNNDKKLGQEIENLTHQKIYYLNSNPTAENIALYLKQEILPSLFQKSDFRIEKLKLYETPNCWVEV